MTHFFKVHDNDACRPTKIADDDDASCPTEIEDDDNEDL